MKPETAIKRLTALATWAPTAADREALRMGALAIQIIEGQDSFIGVAPEAGEALERPDKRET